jgi:hypothetical protein
MHEGFSVVLYHELDLLQLLQPVADKPTREQSKQVHVSTLLNACAGAQSVVAPLSLREL